MMAHNACILTEESRAGALVTVWILSSAPRPPRALYEPGSLLYCCVESCHLRCRYYKNRGIAVTETSEFSDVHNISEIGL